MPPLALLPQAVIYLDSRLINETHLEVKEDPMLTDECRERTCASLSLHRKA
jgi:hypothetical protein